MVLSGSMPIMMATSPNCRSRSSRSVRRSCLRANSTARLQASTVLPDPPLGENRVTTLPSAWPRRPYRRRRPARPAARECAFLMVNTIPSVSCGSSTTSWMPACSASDSRLLALAEVTRTIGAAVTARIASISAVGHVLGGGGAVQDDLRGGLGQLGAGLDRVGGRADELDVGVVGEALPDLRQAVGGAGDEDLDRGLVRHYFFTPDTQMGREFLTCTAVRPVPKVLHGVATDWPVSWAPWLGRRAIQNSPVARISIRSGRRFCGTAMMTASPPVAVIGAGRAVGAGGGGQRHPGHAGVVGGEHLDVRDDAAGDRLLLVLAVVDRGLDRRLAVDVDVIAGLERAAEDAVGVEGELDGAHRAVDLVDDRRVLGVREHRGRDLRAGGDVRRRRERVFSDAIDVKAPGTTSLVATWRVVKAPPSTSVFTGSAGDDVTLGRRRPSWS